MTSLLEQDFLATLLSSNSFYATVVAYLAVACGLGLAAVVLWYKRIQRQPPRRLLQDNSGAASVVDFVLTIPVFLSIVMLVVQFMIMANDALIVHYSAYAAARSGRVWIPRDANKAQEQAEIAARLALIAASPADLSVTSNPGSFPASLLRALSDSTGYAQRGNVFVQKARYAFDPRNSTVVLQAMPNPVSAPHVNAQAVTARVTYRIHLGIPVAKVLGSNRGDGQYYQTITAEMTLL